LNVQGQQQLSRNLRVLADKIGDRKQVLGDILDTVKERTDKIFESGGKNLGKNPKWKPLSPVTNEMRRKRILHYKNAPNRPGIMRWTGKLQESTEKEVSNDRARLTYTAEYAGYHQSGGKKLPKRAIIDLDNPKSGGKKLPKRAIIDLDNPTNEKIIKVIQESIHQALGIFGRQI